MITPSYLLHSSHLQAQSVLIFLFWMVLIIYLVIRHDIKKEKNERTVK